MITIDFYNYDRKTYTVNKILGEPVTLSGVFWDKVNVMTPVINVKLNQVFTFNYCYIRELNRYYYVVGFDIVDADTWTVRLSIDVLKTYEADIMAATATIEDRDNADKFISVRQNIYDVRPNVEKIDFTENVFDPKGSVIMVTLKGN